MKPICVFYHCLFFTGDPPRLLRTAWPIVEEQMSVMQNSGLTDAASEIVCGINGGEESQKLADTLLPAKAHKIYHGMDSHSELPTIFQLENWLKTHPNWYVLYFHSKGATRPAGDDYRTRWRRCMMRNLVEHWKQCVTDLEHGYESVGCHWLTNAMYPQVPKGQNIWAGNFWWATSNFLITLPSMMLRDRLRISGLYAAESCFEAEVWIGNGQRLPRVKDYHPEWPS